MEGFWDTFTRTSLRVWKRGSGSWRSKVSVRSVDFDLLFHPDSEFRNMKMVLAYDLARITKILFKARGMFNKALQMKINFWHSLKCWITVDEKKYLTKIMIKMLLYWFCLSLLRFPQCQKSVLYLKQSLPASTLVCTYLQALHEWFVLCGTSLQIVRSG